jgi:VWFA-related protein
MIVGLVVAALAGLLTALSAQTPTSPQRSNYLLRENVHLVIVPVTVKSRDGSLVDDLIREDFRVFEDGHERPIQYFSNESMPLAAVILLDTGMSQLSLGAVRTTLRSLGDTFAPGDEEAAMLFDNTIRLVPDFTSQAELLVTTVEKALPEAAGPGPSILGGPLGQPTTINGVAVNRPGTAPVPTSPVQKRLDDALYAAVQRLKTRPPGHRRVVMIISDGANGSDNEISHHEAMDALEASDVTVYALSFGGGWAMKRADLLARVARETGGDIAYVQRRAGLDRAFPRLANGARNSYVLGFAPASADGEFHEIQVRVSRSGVRWIARNRFLSPPSK